jgi:hypothetical protein
MGGKVEEGRLVGLNGMWCVNQRSMEALVCGTLEQ